MTQKLQEILQDINPSLAELTQDIEKLIFVSPRAAMQTTCTMAETLVRQVADLEEMEHRALSFGELQMKLKNDGVITQETDNAIHFMRKQGNVASHNGTRKILIREALMCLEAQHVILTWFIETYASPELEVPAYTEPVRERSSESREDLLGHIEQLMQQLVQKQPASVKVPGSERVSRNISYKEQRLEVPHFLRNACFFEELHLFVQERYCCSSDKNRRRTVRLHWYAFLRNKNPPPSAK